MRRLLVASASILLVTAAPGRRCVRRIVVAILAGRPPAPGADVRVIMRRLGPRGAPDPAFRTRVLRIGRGFTSGWHSTRGRIVIAVGYSSSSAPGGVVLHRLRG